MNSRDRVQTALNHEVPDRVPLDLGSGPTTVCMSVPSINCASPATRPTRHTRQVVEPYQMLGEFQPDLMTALGWM